MNHWLEDFAFHTEIGVGIFLLAGSLALFIALFTGGFDSIRAALRNPIYALRQE